MSCLHVTDRVTCPTFFRADDTFLYSSAVPKRYWSELNYISVDISLLRLRLQLTWLARQLVWAPNSYSKECEFWSPAWKWTKLSDDICRRPMVCTNMCTALQMKGSWKSNINVWFPFLYSQKWNCYFHNLIIMFCLAVPTLTYLWDIYIFPGSVCLFCCREICGPILGIYISRSQTHECGNWDSGLVIPRKGIHKWDFPSSAAIQREENPRVKEGGEPLLLCQLRWVEGVGPKEDDSKKRAGLFQYYVPSISILYISVGKCRIIKWILCMESAGDGFIRTQQNNYVKTGKLCSHNEV
jgi:hypothetical protein